MPIAVHSIHVTLPPASRLLKLTHLAQLGRPQAIVKLLPAVAGRLRDAPTFRHTSATGVRLAQRKRNLFAAELHNQWPALMRSKAAGLQSLLVESRGHVITQKNTVALVKCFIKDVPQIDLRFKSYPALW